MITEESLARLNAWQLFDQAWRSAFKTIWQWPLLVLCSWLLYALFCSTDRYFLPFAANENFLQRVINGGFYDCLQAATFAPLVVVVVRRIIQGDVVDADVWSKRVFWVAVTLMVRELVILVLAIPLWLPRDAFFSNIYVEHVSYARMYATYFALDVLPNYLWYLADLLISVRVALILPILSLGVSNWQNAFKEGWDSMRGNYMFAITAGVLATFPYLIFENFVYSHFYRNLISPEFAPGAYPLSLKEVEALLIRSGVLLGRYMIYAALAAWLYRVITARNAVSRA